MLDAIHLINCQSLKDVRYELAKDRVNVIKAPNNVGKSVLFKMLKITASPKYYSPAERKELIRWGEDTAIVSYILDTGEVYSTVVQPTKVFYAYQEYEGAEMTLIDHLTPEELKKIGLLEHDQYVANVLDVDQDLILVKSNLKSNCNLIQLLIYDDNLEKLKDSVKCEIQNCNNFESILGKELVKAEALVNSSQYIDTSNMEEVYSFISNSCDLLDKLISIDNVASIINLENQKYLDISKELDMLQKLGQIINVKIKKIQNVPKDELISILDKLYHLPTIKLIKPLPNSNLVEILSKLNTVREKSSKIKNINSIKEQMDDDYEKLRNSSTCIECDRFGKVLLCNDKCIHISE